MKVAIIGGTGDQGIGLALRFLISGEEVLIGSRDIKKAENTVETIKEILKEDKVDNLTAMTNQDAASQGDIVVLTVPLQAQVATLTTIKANLENKIMVDATVPLDSCLSGSSIRYVDLWEGSAAERSAEMLKDKNVSVVSAFNNISSGALIKIEEDVECDCLISGDDSKAKEMTMELAEKIPGVRAIDCGALENARIVEKITPLLINLNIRNKSRKVGIRVTQI
ncbi:MAG: NADPH-dependent F420 reductase [Methanobacteriaceae archaeon]|nr:NADPH-dependent F420 reductase [Methanobacteriaceae archaeon]